MATDVRQSTQEAAGITPVSAPPAATQTPEARQALYKSIRERLRRSALEVKGRPGKAYFWGRKHDEVEMSRYTFLGFVVAQTDPRKPEIQAAGMKADGTFEVGDVILLEMDSLEYQALQDEYNARAHAQLREVPETFIAEVDQSQTDKYKPTAFKVNK